MIKTIYTSLKKNSVKYMIEHINIALLNFINQSAD